MRIGEILRRNDTPAVRGRPAGKLQADPLCHVRDVRVDVAGAIDIVRGKLVERYLSTSIGCVAVTLRVIGGGGDRRGAIGGVLHAERGEDLALQHRIPVCGALRSGDNAAGKDVSDIGVGEGRAEARHRFDVSQGTNEGRSVEAEVHEKVVGVRREAGALRGQVEDAELARHPRVAHLEVGVEIDDAIVPTQLALIDGDRNRRGKERLGHRPDLEDGLRVDRGTALAAHPEAFGINQLVAGDDADREPRHVEAFHVGCDIVFETWGKRLDLLFDRWGGTRRLRRGSALDRERRRDEGR